MIKVNCDGCFKVMMTIDCYSGNRDQNHDDTLSWYSDGRKVCIIAWFMISPLTWPATNSGSQRPSMTVGIILIESGIVLKPEKMSLILKTSQCRDPWHGQHKVHHRYL